MGQVADRIYFVEAGNGYMRVTVTQRSIEYRGERRAVAKVAWDELVGENSLGKVVEKHSPTRLFIAKLANSSLLEREKLFYQFVAKIKFKLIGIEWRVE